METNKELVDLVAFIAKYLVDHPEEVSVQDVPGEQTSIIELAVARDDIGKVIGKMGNTAKAIRTILSAVAAKNHKKAILEIIE